MAQAIDESALTNISAITGVSEVRWRCFALSREAPDGATFSERGELCDPFFAAYLDLSRQGKLCSWTAAEPPLDGMAERPSPRRLLWVWDLTEDPGTDWAPPGMALQDHGILSDPQSRLASHFTSAMAAFVTRILASHAGVRLGAYALFADRAPDKPLAADAAGTLAVRTSPFWSGHTVFLRISVEQLPVLPLDPLTATPGQHVLVAPFGAPATFDGVFGPCEPTLWATWACLSPHVDARPPPMPASHLAVSCTLDGRPVLLPAAALLAPCHPPAAARGADLTAPLQPAMWEALLRNLQNTFQPTGSMLPLAAKESLVVDGAPPDYWNYVEPVHQFEDNSSVVQPPAAVTPSTSLTSSLYDLAASRMMDGGSLSMSSWTSDVFGDSNTEQPFNTDSIETYLDFFDSDGGASAGAASVNVAAATSRSAADFTSGSPAQFGVSDGAPQTATPAALAAATPTLVHVYASPYEGPGAAGAVLHTPDGHVVLHSPAHSAVEGEQLLLLSTGSASVAKYSYTPSTTAVAAEPAYRPDRLFIPTSPQRRGTLQRSGVPSAVITPESIGGDAASDRMDDDGGDGDDDAGVPKSPRTATMSSSEDEDASSASSGDDSSDDMDDDEGGDDGKAAKRYSPVAAASLLLWLSRSPVRPAEAHASTESSALDVRELLGGGGGGDARRSASTVNIVNSVDMVALQELVGQAAGRFPVGAGDGGKCDGEACAVHLASPRTALRMCLFVHRALSSRLAMTFGVGAASGRALRGPLTLHQLSDMTDAEANTSGYEAKLKFARKRRIGERPAFETLELPQVLVGYEGEWMQAAAGVLALWDAVAVEPFAASKDLAYVVLTPQAGDLSVHVRAFVREVATAYQACRLGRLLPLEHEGLTAGGLLEVPLPTPKVDADAFENQMAAFALALQRLAGSLGAVLAQGDKPVVLYVVDPFRDARSAFRLCQAFSGCAASLERPQLQRRLLLQLLPLRSVLAQTSGGSAASIVREVAFAVFNRCRAIESDERGAVQLPRRQRPRAALYAPAFVIAPARPAPLTVTFPAAAARFVTERVLHVAYAIARGGQWLAACWTDEAGEIFETRVFPADAALSDAIDSLWAATTRMTSATTFPWRVVIARDGALPTHESDVWERCWAPLTSAMAPLRDGAPPPVSPAGHTFGINSVSLVSVTAMADLQVMAAAGGGGAAPPASAAAGAAPPAEEEPARLVVTHRVSLAGAPALAAACLIAESSRSPWPTAWELALRAHHYRTEPLRSNMAYSAWSAAGTPPWALLSDVARQFYALSFIDAPADRAAQGPTVKLPAHLKAVRHVAAALAHIEPVHSPITASDAAAL